MANKDSDYDGWVLRLLERGEDILYSFSEHEWREFCREKMFDYHGFEPTEAQLDTLSERIDYVQELPETIGFMVDEKATYRDARGRFTSEVTERVSTKPQFRDDKGRFIRASTANEMLTKELELRGIRKGKRNETE